MTQRTGSRIQRARAGRGIPMVNLFSDRSAITPAELAISKKSRRPTSERKEFQVNERVYEGLSVKMKQLKKLRALKKRVEQALNSVEEPIRSAAKDQWLMEFIDSGDNPQTFVLKCGDSECLVVPQDAYKKLDEKKATNLREKYGPNVVQVNRLFVVDPLMINAPSKDVTKSYGQLISDFIMQCPQIAEEHRNEIIKTITEYRVKPGLIDSMIDYEDAENMIDDLGVVFQLK